MEGARERAIEPAPAPVETPAPRARLVDQPRCPYCHEGLTRGVEPAACVQCFALHHPDCLREHTRCAACAAPHPRYSPRPPPTGPLTLPRLAGRLLGNALQRAPYALQILPVVVAIGVIVRANRSLPPELEAAAWAAFLALPLMALGDAIALGGCLLLLGLSPLPIQPDLRLAFTAGAVVVLTLGLVRAVVRWSRARS